MPQNLYSQFLIRQWKGGIRELKNEIQMCVALFSQGELYCPGDYTIKSDGSSLSDIVSNVENNQIEIALKKHQYNISATARQLKIPRQTLEFKIKKHQIMKIN
ncbi:MAG: hypothetical protein GY730_06370 [bacterium]|nr:hypothetical protein [bacterium]